LLHKAVEPLGAEGDALVSQVLGFVDNMQVGVLGSVGLGLLIYTVISLIQKVERAFNEIWRVSQTRSMAQRFSNYLSVIVIGPVLVVSAIGSTAGLVGSDFVRSLLEIQPFGALFAALSKLTPYLMIIALFSFVYSFIPNTKVKFRYALIGGIVAGIVWQSAIYGFTQFVVNSNYKAIYSGFAVGILLLIWIYVAWLILLMGASVAFYSQNAKHIRREHQLTTSACLDERVGLGLFFLVARTFQDRQGFTPMVDVDRAMRAGPEIMERLLKKLIRAQLVTFAGKNGEGLVPARPLELISIAEVLQAVRSQEQLYPVYVSADKQAAEVIREIDDAVASKYGSLSVAQWLKQHQD
jgi:membrane protein